MIRIATTITQSASVSIHALDDEDLPVLGMLVFRTPASEIAQTLGLTPGALRQRIMRMLARLKVPVPDHAG